MAQTVIKVGPDTESTGPKKYVLKWPGSTYDRMDPYDENYPNLDEICADLDAGKDIVVCLDTGYGNLAYPIRQQYEPNNLTLVWVWNDGSDALKVSVCYYYNNEWYGDFTTTSVALSRS